MNGYIGLTQNEKDYILDDIMTKAENKGFKNTFYDATKEKRYFDKVNQILIIFVKKDELNRYAILTDLLQFDPVKNTISIHFNDIKTLVTNPFTPKQHSVKTKSKLSCLLMFDYDIFLFTLFSDNKLVYDIRKTYDITLYSYSIKRCSYNYNNINLGYNKDFINFNEKSSKMYEFYSYAKGTN